MKGILFLLGLLLVAFSGCLQLCQAITEADVTKFSEECMKEVGISADETKLIMADKMADVNDKPFSDKMKCYLLCFYKKMGIIDANGKPNTALAIGFFEHRFDQHKNKVKPALAKCATAKGANPCDDVYKFEICMLDSIKGK